MSFAMSSQVSTPQSESACAGSSSSTAPLRRLCCKTQWPPLLGPCRTDDCDKKKRKAAVELSQTPVKKTRRRKTLLQQAVAEGVVPAARKPFAIFVQEHISRVKGLSKAACQKGFKELAMTWKGLPEDKKDCYRQKARDEHANQREAAACSGLRIRMRFTNSFPSPCCRLNKKKKNRSSPEASSCHRSDLLLPKEQLRSEKKAAIETAFSIGPFDISRGEPLGQGSYGKVMKGVHKVTGQPVALKIYNSFSSSDYTAELKCLQTLLLKLDSTSRPLFPTMLDHFEKPIPCICLDYGGVAVSKICPMSSQLALQAAKQLRAALLAMHNVGVIHTDVKPGNCLWMHASGQLKLIDFGMSVLVPFSEKTISFNEYGTEQYRAPELWWAVGKKNPLQRL
jgi:hypothetical protein